MCYSNFKLHFFCIHFIYIPLPCLLDILDNKILRQILYICKTKVYIPYDDIWHCPPKKIKIQVHSHSVQLFVYIYK